MNFDWQESTSAGSCRFGSSKSLLQIASKNILLKVCSARYEIDAFIDLIEFFYECVTFDRTFRKTFEGMLLKVCTDFTVPSICIRVLPLFAFLCTSFSKSSKSCSLDQTVRLKFRIEFFKLLLDPASPADY